MLDAISILRILTLLLEGRAKRLCSVLIVDNSHITTLELGSDDSKNNNISVDASKEDTDDLSVVVALSLVKRRQRELLADLGFNGGTCAGCKVAKLVSGTDNKGSESARRQLHEMDGDDTPSTLDAELLEESSCDDGLGRGEGVGVKEGTTDDASHDDSKTATEDGRAVTHGGSSSDSTKVSNNLSDGDRVGVELVLVLEHGGVEILTSVGHEVEASHEKDHVSQKEPMALESNLSLGDESTSDIRASRLTNGYTLAICLCLGKAQSEQDDQNGRACTEPEERAPSTVRGVVDKSTGEDYSKKVAKGITLLQHSTNDTASLFRTVFKCSGCKWSVMRKYKLIDETYQQRFRKVLP
jgi:hypothetical protein